jgi:ferric-dicitrate binding protein FerR (iron transport regulator)
MSDDRWLWDRTGPEDEEAERLERLLRPMGHDPAARPPTGRLLFFRRPLFLGLAAAVALAAVGVSLWKVLDREPGSYPGSAQPLAGVLLDGAPVAAGAWVEAGTASRELVLADAGRVTLDPGARLRVDRSGADEARLFLQRGRLEARIGADVKPRWFRVDTDAANCVDLGCHYELVASSEGTRVRVTTGRVSFEGPGGREVYVPAGATCTARAGRGPGTPRFEDATARLAAAADAFDAASTPESRRAAAAALVAAVEKPRDTLAAWHLLQDPDDAVVARALSSLTLRWGRPEGAATEGRPSASDLSLWRDHLSRGW